MRFGTQQQSLNISLTSIGLLWNIIDFLCHDLDDSIDVARIQLLWVALGCTIVYNVSGRIECFQYIGNPYNRYVFTRPLAVCVVTDVLRFARVPAKRFLVRLLLTAFH